MLIPSFYAGILFYNVCFTLLCKVYQQSNFSCQKYQNLELENCCAIYIPRLLVATYLLLKVFIKLNNVHILILHQIFFTLYI